MKNEEIRDKIYLVLEKFLLWLEQVGYESFDKDDFWASNSGIFTRKLFFKNKLVSLPFVMWGELLENFFPKVQKLYGKPHREVIADAHFAMGFFNLYEVTGSLEYLNKGKLLLNSIKDNTISGYKGNAWGYSLGWQTSTGFWKAGIPFITVTPYAFWSFKRYYEISGDERALSICLSAADFALYDLKEKKMPNGKICSSYSPTKRDEVINANTYRAALLYETYSLTGINKYKIAADKNLDCVLSYQGVNGEWGYEAKPLSNTFIDNFHTCIVLRNLYKCYLINQEKKILDAVIKGYQYYKNNLFYKNGKPKHFSKKKYPKFRKYEMYDYAEGIVLGVLLKDIIPGAFEKAKWLALDLIQNYQTKKGYFVTRVTSLGTKHKVPYVRWPQSQLFHALTLILKEIN